jgi:hypothetical protein
MPHLGERCRQLDAQVLLMYGSETDPMFVDCAEALDAILPHFTVLRLPAPSLGGGLTVSNGVVPVGPPVDQDVLGDRV